MTSGAARPSSFPKEVRLRRRAEFLSVQEKGRKYSAECLMALVLPQATPGARARVGLTVSSKVGNAVVRNRVRRRLRELFRRGQATLPPGLDIVVIARHGAAEADFARLQRSYEQLARDVRRRRA